MDLHGRTPTQDTERRANRQVASPSLGAPAPTQHLNILIVEDSAAEACAVRGLVEESRYGDANLLLANDPVAAREMLAAQRFDLVISDVWLGDKMSISLIKEIGQDSPHLPVIMLSIFQRAGAHLVEASDSLFYLSKLGLTPRLIEDTIAMALNRGERAGRM